MLPRSLLELLDGGVLALDGPVPLVLLCFVTFRIQQISTLTVKTLLDCGCPLMLVNAAGGLIAAETTGMHLGGKVLLRQFCLQH